MNKHYIREGHEPTNEELGITPILPFEKLCAWIIVGACALAALLAVATTAHAQTRTATISFERPTKYTDDSDIAASTPVSYRVYQGAKGQTKTLVGTITSTNTTISSGLQAGEYCWEVTAVVGTEESSRSNEACKSFKAAQTVTITVT